MKRKTNNVRKFALLSPFRHASLHRTSTRVTTRIDPKGFSIVKYGTRQDQFHKSPLQSHQFKHLLPCTRNTNDSCFGSFCFGSLFSEPENVACTSSTHFSTQSVNNSQLLSIIPHRFFAGPTHLSSHLHKTSSLPNKALAKAQRFVSLIVLSNSSSANTTAHKRDLFLLFFSKNCRSQCVDGRLPLFCPIPTKCQRPISDPTTCCSSACYRSVDTTQTSSDISNLFW